MALHVVAGSGPVGSGTALTLAEMGHDVRVLTRSGSGPEHPAIERRALDINDEHALVAAARDAAALYNCVNPPYNQWEKLWPPMAKSLLKASEASGAVLVTMGNLYGYGPVDGPMHEATPLAATSRKGKVRVRMWREAKAAHDAGRVRATEVRASDFFGPSVRDAHMGERLVPKLLRGRTLRVVGDPDQAHTFSYMPDVVRALAIAGTDERAWGQPWHAPSGPPISQRLIINALAKAAGLEPPRVKTLSPTLLSVVGLAMPVLREIGEIAYQFERPFVMDSTRFTDTFDMLATPLEQAAFATVAWYRDRDGAASASGGRAVGRAAA